MNSPAVEGPLECHVRPQLTPWFPSATKPARAGMYQVQDHTMNCGCCWFDAHWNGREWHTDLFTRGVFNTLLFDSQVKRWRGLAKRPNDGAKLATRGHGVNDEHEDRSRQPNRGGSS